MGRKSFIMKKSLVFLLIVFSGALIVACNKHTSGPDEGYGPNSLFPLTAGDTWYYNDSAFSDTSLLAAYADTMVATKTQYTDPQTGLIYLELNNPNGWFRGSYIAVDANNYAVYEVDSPAFQPYTFFATVTQDGAIANPYTDISNPACPITYAQYGYANPVNVYGFSAYENAEVVTDCHGVVLEETNSYLSQGIGVVRIEDYLTDTTGGKNIFYEDYSQTLTAKNLH